MALRLALDVNRYADFCRGVGTAVDALRRASEIIVPFVVLAELRAGFRCGGPSQHNERVLGRFLQSPRVTVLFAELRQAGTPIPTNDLWIAALAVQHDLTLLTRDKHFNRVPLIPRI